MNSERDAAGRPFFVMPAIYRAKRVKQFAKQILEPGGLCLSGWLLSEGLPQWRNDIEGYGMTVACAVAESQK